MRFALKFVLVRLIARALNVSSHPNATPERRALELRSSALAWWVSASERGPVRAVSEMSAPMRFAPSRFAPSRSAPTRVAPLKSSPHRLGAASDQLRGPPRQRGQHVVAPNARSSSSASLARSGSPPLGRGLSGSRVTADRSRRSSSCTTLRAEEKPSRVTRL